MCAYMVFCLYKLRGESLWFRYFFYLYKFTFVVYRFIFGWVGGEWFFCYFVVFRCSSFCFGGLFTFFYFLWFVSFWFRKVGVFGCG